MSFFKKIYEDELMKKTLKFIKQYKKYFILLLVIFCLWLTWEWFVYHTNTHYPLPDEGNVKYYNRRG